MIVYQAAILASPPAGYSLDNARICYQTWLRDLTASAITASSTDPDTAVDAPLRPDTAEYWSPTSLPATWLIDLGAARAIDYVGIAGHNLGSAGCSVTVETSDGSTAGSPSELAWTTFANSIAPADDAPLLFLDDAVEHRYLRLTITGGAVMPRIPVVYAGEQLAMPRPIYGGQTPPSLSRNTVLMNSISRGGQFLGQNYRRHGVEGNAGPWRHLDPTWVRETLDPFIKAARRYPFFYAWRPSDWPLEVVFAWAKDDIRPRNMGIREFMEVSFGFAGVGHE